MSVSESVIQSSVRSFVRSFSRHVNVRQKFLPSTFHPLEPCQLSRIGSFCPSADEPLCLPGSCILDRCCLICIVACECVCVRLWSSSFSSSFPSIQFAVSRLKPSQLSALYFPFVLREPGKNKLFIELGWSGTRKIPNTINYIHG